MIQLHFTHEIERPIYAEGADPVGCLPQHPLPSSYGKLDPAGCPSRPLPPRILIAKPTRSQHTRKHGGPGWGRDLPCSNQIGIYIPQLPSAEYKQGGTWPHLLTTPSNLAATQKGT